MEKSMNNPVILVKNLSKSYRGKPAIQNLGFTVPEGAIYGLLGPNGVGKTTTIRILMNLIAATQGQAEILGKKCSSLKPADFTDIGYVSENQQLPEWMSLQQLSDYLAPFYLNWDKLYERELSDQLDLPRNVRLKDMSRGMKMKAALGVSMAYRPKLLVLDEPFSGLDPVVRDEFSAAVLSLVSDSGCSVLLSSHDVEEVQRLCDWVGIMKQGRMEISEPLEKLQERHRKLSIRLPQGEKASGLWEKPMELLGEENDLLQLLHRDFEGDVSLASIKSRLPINSVVEVESLSLRDIYLSINRKLKSDL